MVLAREKDGAWRFCVDYRKLNSVTQRDIYPIPRIDDSLDALGGSQWFTTLDFLTGYWQVELSDDAREKSMASRCFCWPHISTSNLRALDGNYIQMSVVESLA